MNNVIYDNIVVVSTNKTCWDEGEKPKNEQSELISINICLLTINTLRTHSRCSFVIKPQKSTISDYCFETTGLTEKIVNSGSDLATTSKNIITKFNTQNRVVASYGNESYEDLKENEIVGNRHINIQSMLPIIFNLKSEVDLLSATKIVGIEYEGEEYDTLNNAFNASRVLAEIIRGGMSHK